MNKQNYLQTQIIGENKDIIQTYGYLWLLAESQINKWIINIVHYNGFTNISPMEVSILGTMKNPILGISLSQISEQFYFKQKHSYFGLCYDKMKYRKIKKVVLLWLTIISIKGYTKITDRVRKYLSELVPQHP